jgi:predicted nucleic acid-binding protein
MDGLHLACAIEGRADIFLTVDAALHRKARDLRELRVSMPLLWLASFEEENHENQ